MNKKQRLHTAYQRHIDFIKVLGIVFLAYCATAITVIWYLLNKDHYSEVIYRFFVSAVICFFLGIIVCVVASIRQGVADDINNKLYAVWKCKPSTIYSFTKKMSRYKKKTATFNFLFASAVTLVLGLVMFFNNAGHYLGIVVLCASGILLIIAVIMLPYVQYLLLKLRTAVFGDAKEIIFSRCGIWYCGKVYYFGSNSVLFHRAERKEQHGFDSIVFYFTYSRGFQQRAMELVVPVPSKMAYAADDLVAEFNRSDLLQDSKNNKFFKH